MGAECQLRVALQLSVSVVVWCRCRFLRCRSPVGHGRVTCLSIYCGPDVDFGSGPKLWIDTLDQQAEDEDPLVIAPLPAAADADADTPADAETAAASAEAAANADPSARVGGVSGRGQGESVLQLFKAYLEDESILKVRKTRTRTRLVFFLFQAGTDRTGRMHRHAPTCAVPPVQLSNGVSSI